MKVAHALCAQPNALTQIESDDSNSFCGETAGLGKRSNSDREPWRFVDFTLLL